jgi:competence protein CoiA
MKFAYVDGNKTEATKGIKGLCRSCGSELIAKCGEVYVNHWSHKGNRNCDQWWENETEWHRSWKDKFPVDWQEVIHFDDSGEKHIADVKTESDWVLEFQHSLIKSEERRSRNNFYPKLVWVVDGTRRKTDKIQFQKILKEESSIVNREPSILRAHFPYECRLLKEWHGSNALVFFDFQEEKDAKQSMLWFLFPKNSSGEAYLSPFSRAKFIELHNKNNFDELVNNIILPILEILARNKQIEHVNNMRAQTNRLPGFGRHMSNIRRRRRRL